MCAGLNNTSLDSTVSSQSIINKDGIAIYTDSLIPAEKSELFLLQLSKNIQWKNDESVIFGKHYITRRKTAWYGDRPFNYTYSKIKRTALPWTNELLEIKHIVENNESTKFNSCLLNLYHDGDDGMGWHSDNEKELIKNGVIASVSLGAERKFSFRHKKTKEKIDLVLRNGSLLVMKEQIQAHWMHQLPNRTPATLPRSRLNSPSTKIFNIMQVRMTPEIKTCPVIQDALRFQHRYFPFLSISLAAETPMTTSRNIRHGELVASPLTLSRPMKPIPR